MPFSSPGPFREVNLTGLKSDTLYHYSIGSCHDHTFRTLPSPGSSDFIIDAEGDIGASNDYQDVLPVQRLIAAHLPAFVLVLGDLSYGNPNGQKAVDQHFNDVMIWSQDVAYMPAWGNHEWDVRKYDDLRNYKGRFEFPHSQTSRDAPNLGCCGKDWYWFDYGNVRFIAYPEPYTSETWSEWYEKTKILMDQAQADPDITFVVTFGHRAPYTSGYHHSALQLRGYVDMLSRHHSKYMLNLNGHSHDYERSKVEDGVVSVTAGIGGSELEELQTACLFRLCPQPSWSRFRAMHFGVLRLHFASAEIQGSFICGPAGGGKNDIHCAPGSVVDHFTIGARH
ncbi:MAG: metallophosphoesterase [Terriglobia bacterium]